MVDRPRRVILCPSCGRLTNADAAECLICGRRNPGMWGMTGIAQRLFRGRDTTGIITILCVVLYVTSLVLDPAAAMRPMSGFELFSPSPFALVALGATGTSLWDAGRWWTVLTAVYLHGGVLHILFNVLWIRQLGPEVEEIYGRARYLVIFTIAGAAGFILSDVVGVRLTVGASGAVFGLLGAMIAFGKKRGGAFGRLVLTQYGQWALIMFVFGLLPGTAVNNWAHAGGFLAGFAGASVLSFKSERRETGLDRMLAGGAAVLTIVAFAVTLWTTFIG